MKIDEVKKLSPFELLLYWIIERENIRIRKEKGEKFLTDDEIFQKWRFTNWNRNYDKTTKYLYENIWNKINDNKILFFNIVIHRQFSKIETSEKIGILYEKNFDKIIELKKKKFKLFTGAFTRCISFKSLLKSFEYAYDNAQIFLDIINNEKSLEKTFNYLLKIPTIGKFMAWQILADLRFSNIFKNIVPIDDEQFIVLGRGAELGLKFLKIENKIDNIIKLKNDCNENLKNYNIKLNLFDLEHTLCEYSKYYKILHFNKKGRQKFIYKKFNE